MVPFLGHGIGLRPQHFPDLLEQGRRADWFEVITENFLQRRRPAARRSGVACARDRPVVLHGVSLSVGLGRPARHAVPATTLRALADARRAGLGVGPPLLGQPSAVTTRTTCCPCPSPRSRSPTSCRASAQCRTRSGGSIVARERLELPRPSRTRR